MARGRGAGLALKGLQWFLRSIEFLCAALILGIFSYFLATLHNHGLPISNDLRAVEGISGAAVLYTLLGLLLLYFIAGHPFTSIIAIILDVAFLAAFGYVAYQNRNGARSCSGDVDTVFGSGNADTGNQVSTASGSTILPSFKQACQLQTACFAVAIVAIVFFLLTALVEIALARHRRAEKAFGPSPANNYTEGSGTGNRRRGLFGRKKRDEAVLAAGGIAEHEKRHPDSLPPHITPSNIRDSYNTDNTAVGNEPVIGHRKYGQTSDVTDGYPTIHDYPNRNSGYSNTTPANRNSGRGYDESRSTSYFTAPITHNSEYRVGGSGEVPASQYGQHSVRNSGNF